MMPYYGADLGGENDEEEGEGNEKMVIKRSVTMGGVTVTIAEHSTSPVEFATHSSE